MLAWVRTAVSLIGFGFAIVQFFERMNQFSGVSTERFPAAPKYLGLALIFCGVMALVRLGLAVPMDDPLPLERQLRRWSLGPRKTGMQTPILWVAALLAGIGLFAFAAVLLRLV